MNRPNKKRRLPSLAAVLTVLLMMALGFGAGWLGAWMADHADLAGWQLLALLAAAAVGVLVQIVLHEGGHLAAGLATGYGFVSFRIGSVMLLKKDGRLQFFRYQLAGTGGQCLLAPPPWREEGFPSLLYNLGGPAANLLSAALCGLGAWLCWQKAPLAAGLWGVWAMLGLYLGLVNGIPLKIQGMPNDGYNALCLRGDKAAQRAIWAQLAINAAQIEGRRLKDLPAEWFELPGGAGPDDPLKGAVWVCRYSRLLDEGRYEDAAALRARLLGSGARGVFPADGGPDRGRPGRPAGKTAAGLPQADEVASWHGAGPLWGGAGRRQNGGSRPAAQSPGQNAGGLALRRRRRVGPGAAGLGRAEAL